MNQWKQQKSTSSLGLNDTINEPTKKPVSARLAGWQQKVDTVEKDTAEPVFKTPGKNTAVIRGAVGTKVSFDSCVFQTFKICNSKNIETLG